MSDYSAEAHQDVVAKWDILSPHISIVLLDPNKRYADLHFFGILLPKFVIVIVTNFITPFYWMRPYAYLFIYLFIYLFSQVIIVITENTVA